MSDPIVRVSRVEDVAAETSWLTTAETVRWQRFARSADRQAYLAAHVLVRLVAGELAGVEPARLELTHDCPDCGAGDHGRPLLEGLEHVHISLSHTRGWVGALAADARCGIDVEPVGNVPDRALTEAERAWAGPDAVRRTRLWSRKEALAKAGLADVTDFWGVDARDPDGVVDWTAADGSAVGAWLVGRPSHRPGRPGRSQ